MNDADNIAQSAFVCVGTSLSDQFVACRTPLHQDSELRELYYQSNASAPPCSPNKINERRMYLGDQVRLTEISDMNSEH